MKSICFSVIVYSWFVFSCNAACPTSGGLKFHIGNGQWADSDGSLFVAIKYTVGSGTNAKDVLSPYKEMNDGCKHPRFQKNTNEYFNQFNTELATATDVKEIRFVGDTSLSNADGVDIETMDFYYGAGLTNSKRMSIYQGSSSCILSTNSFKIDDGGCIVFSWKWVSGETATAGDIISEFPHKSRHNWMGAIPDDTLLYNINFPGTHDSGAYGTESYGDPAVEICQVHNIRQQLDKGVRALDIRLAGYSGDDSAGDCDDFAVYHGIYQQNDHFSTVQQQMYDFLDANPSECIVVLAGKEEGADDDVWFEDILENEDHAECFKEQIQSNKAYWLMDSETNVVPTLGECRGHIILYYGTQSGWMTDMADDYAGYGFLKNEYRKSWYQADQYCVQNKYDLDEDSLQENINVKWPEITHMLDKPNHASSVCANEMIWNFISCSDFEVFGDYEPWEFAQELRDMVKNEINTRKANGQTRFGVIMLDFAVDQNYYSTSYDYQYVDTIIETNVGVQLSSVIPVQGYKPGNIDNDEYKKPIIIKIRSRDLYIFTVVAIVFIVQSIILTLKCYDGYKSKSHQYKTVKFSDSE